jgi:hypothetical protein
VLGPFLFFGASSAVMLCLVIVFSRLPNDEFVRRIESAGTGQVLRTLALASPGFLAMLLLMTAESGLLLVAEPSVSNWERAAPCGRDRISRVWGTVRLGSFPRRA